jgi:Mor family transcriptional regulator
MNYSRNRAPELLADVAEFISLTLSELVSMEPSKAQHVGKEVAGRLGAYWGGQNLYFPKGLSVKLGERDRQIYADFTGANHHELARKYDITLPWVYQIVKAARKEEISRRQGDMFLTDH